MRRPSRYLYYPTGTRQMLFDRQDGRCTWCGTPLWDGPDAGHHIDHHIPWADRGPHEPGNWRLLHAWCNSRKNGSLPTESLFAEARANPPTEEAARAAAAGYSTVECGTLSCYVNNRCRCGPCRRADADYQKARSETGITADDPRHNTFAGYSAGCRRPCCKEASLEYQRRRRKKGTETGITADDPRHDTYAGYKAGCRLRCCRGAAAARSREDRARMKQKALAAQQGTP